MRVALTIACLAAACSTPPAATITYPLADLPLAPFLRGLPFTGTGTLVVDRALDSATDWSQVDGSAHVRCSDCTLGDNVALAWTAKPTRTKDVAFGRMVFTRADAELTVHRGELVASMHLRAPGFALEARVTAADVRDPREAVFTGCVEFRPTEELRRLDPTSYRALVTTGAPNDAAGRYALRVEGPLAQLRILGQECAVAASASL